MGSKWVERGDVYDVGKRDHATKIKISNAVPTLRLLASKEDPKGLGYKAKHQFEQVRQKHRPRPLSVKSPHQFMPKSAHEKYRKLLNYTNEKSYL